jgi:hypothetical protein
MKCWKVLLVAVIASLAASTVIGQSDDPIGEKLKEAQSVYEKEMENARGRLLDELQRKEDSVRKKGDKGLLDQVRAEREAFESEDRLPRSIQTATFCGRVQQASNSLAAAYKRAVKEYTKAEEDELAEATETALNELLDSIRQSQQSGQWQVNARWTDLLRLVDVQKHTRQGAWVQKGKSVISVPGGFAVLQIPFEPPEEYVLEMTVQRISGKNDFQIGVVVDNARCQVVIDGWNGTITGLSYLNGRSALDNETTHRGPVLPDAKPAKIRTTVRKGFVSMAVDGRTVISWKGDPKQLSSEDLGIPLKSPFIAVQKGGAYKVESMRLAVPSGKPDRSKK